MENNNKSMKETFSKLTAESNQSEHIDISDLSMAMETSAIADSSDDDIICCETLDEAKNLVAECFNEVKTITASEVVRPEFDNFFNTVGSFTTRGNGSRVYQTLDGSVATSPSFKVLEFSKNVRKVEVHDRNRITQEVYAKVVETNRGILPRTRYFTHSEENILSPDTLRLSHIPYIDKDTINDSIFLNDLRNAYPEGIHGDSKGCGEHINDFMMWKLLGITQKEWTGDPRLILRAISEMFPNKYTYQQLKSKDTRLTLKERFEKTVLLKQPWKADDMISGICDLFCTRCMIFNCLAHPAEQIKQPLCLPVMKPTRGEISCGQECFLSTAVDEDIIVVPKIDCTFVMEMFRTLVSQKHDLCEVAKIMKPICSTAEIPTVECREWYNLALTLHQKTSFAEQNEGVLAVLAKRKTVGKQLQSKLYKNFTNSLKKRKMNGIDNYADLIPCDHPGKSCEDDNCACFERGGICTKYCRCDFDCTIKFPGCTCSAGHCSTSVCACFVANWECDPDTCLSCNCDASNPMESGSDKVLLLCRNINVQLKLQKKLKVGVSTIPNAGNGCFLVGCAFPGDLISEYTGEIISHEETERRGIVYDKLKCSYIFRLSHRKSLDAAKFGNLIRFANNDSKYPNCIARTIVVNGEQRVAVYARKHIQNGDEILYDYMYQGEHQSLVEQSSPSKKTSEKPASALR